MRHSANQICWVPVDDIVRDGNEQSGTTVLLAARGDGRYTLLAGTERLIEARAQGRACIDAVVSPSNTLEARTSRLLDRLVRGELHYLDEAEEYRSLISDGMTAQELAARLGRSAAAVHKRLRLLNLGDEVKSELRASGLREGYAHELLRVPGIQGRMKVLKHIKEAGLSVKEAEKLVDEVLSRMPVPLIGGRRMKPLMRDHRLYLNAIRGIVEQMRDAGLGADIQITMGKRVAEARITIPLLKSAKFPE